MENTLENKAKFFALYLDQTIHFIEGWNRGALINDAPKLQKEEFKYLKKAYLELTPLHLISDEDAIEIIGIKEFILRQNNQNSGDFGCSASNIFVNTLDGNNDSYLIHNNHIDYLRSKGYALPYNGLSVEEQVSRGWVQLRT